MGERRSAVCSHCGIVIRRELAAWMGALSGSLHCWPSPSKRHEPPTAAIDHIVAIDSSALNKEVGE